MVHRGHRRGRVVVLFIAVVMAGLIVIGGGVWLAVNGSETMVSGTPRAAESVGRSDEDQIRDVLQAISDAYNRKDVRGTEMNLCARARSRWNPRLERAWLAYRQEQGPFEFSIKSIDVRGAAAHVTGTQTYAKDRRPQAFTAEMGRGTSGWKMCSSR